MTEQPDPEFKAFFVGEWRALHEAVTIPGMPHASWDRKAAYLYWELSRNSAPLDVFGEVIPPPQRPAMPVGGWVEVVKVPAPIVGKSVNPATVWPVWPAPAGIEFHFDAMAVKL